MDRTATRALLLTLAASAVLVITVYFALSPKTRFAGGAELEAEYESPGTESTAPPSSSPLASRPESPSLRDPDDHDCLSPSQVESHPLLQSDGKRWLSVSTTGAAIDAYRSVAATDVASLAEQGDSAAMVVLGAIHVMRARKLPDSQAVPYLMGERAALMAHFRSSPEVPDAAEHYEEARTWFYRAALHGRVMALSNLGRTYEDMRTGPVELGWISQREYDELRNPEKGFLFPTNIYTMAAYRIAPELLGGPAGGIIDAIRPKSERMREIAIEIVDRFEKDRIAAGLPPIVVPESTAPRLEELMDMICDSYLPPRDEG